MVRKYRANGAEIKRLREGLERKSLQKEFADSVGVSERKLRNIENTSAELTVDEADRIAQRLHVKRDAILYAPGLPRLVPPPAPSAPTPVSSGEPATPKTKTYPRYEDLYVHVCKDAGNLFVDASKSHLIVVHILAALNSDTTAYAEEMVQLMQSVSLADREPFSKIDALVELSTRRRLNELFVLLKGNDILVYEEHHTKHLPESYEPRGTLGPEYEWQTIMAFGPPGEYGEDSVKVAVDNGHPWLTDDRITF